MKASKLLMLESFTRKVPELLKVSVSLPDPPSNEAEPAPLQLNASFPLPADEFLQADELGVVDIDAGQTINVNDARFISLEKFIGGSGNDAFNWSADYTATIDGGGGSDTLTWSTSRLTCARAPRQRIATPPPSIVAV